MITLSFALVLSVASVGGEATEGLSTADIESHVAAARKAHALCGPVSVWFCLRRLGHEVDSATVLERAEMGEGGIRLDRLLSLAQSFGLPARAVVFDPKRLDAVPRPAILVIGQSHCVVLGAVDSAQGQARIFEPATGRVGNESAGFLTERWSGEAIVFADPPMPWLAFAWLFVGAATCTIAGVVVARYAGRRLARKGRARQVESLPTDDPDGTGTALRSSD